MANYTKLNIQVKENGQRITKTVRVPKRTKARIFFGMLKRKYSEGFLLLSSWKYQITEA